MAPKDADNLGTSSRAAPTFLPSIVWRWSGGRALRSPSGAFFAEVVPANDARLRPPLQAAISLQPMTAVGRVSRVRSRGWLQQISSTGATRTLRSAAFHRPRPHPAASRVLGCAGRAGFASPAHHLGAAAVVGGRVGAGVALRDADVGQQGRPAAGPGQPHHWGRTWRGLGGLWALWGARNARTSTT